MLNINEEDLKVAIVTKASDAIIDSDSDLSGLIQKEVKARLDKIFVDSAEAQVRAAIAEAVNGAFDRSYQRITTWGEPEGQPTTIRAELEKTVSAYWSEKVDARTGASTNSYNGVTRAEYLMTQVCAKDFSEGLKSSVINVTGALKDGLRGQLAKHMDEMLNELFRIKSLQDQGKVEKPY